MAQSNDLERIHALEMNVKILGKDSDIQTKALEKVDITLDKMETHVEAVSRSQSLMEERIRRQDEINEKLNEKLEETVKLINTRLDEHTANLDSQEEKRLLFLGELKKELIQHIDTVKIQTMHKANEYSPGYKVFKFAVDNWKFFLVVVALLGGLIFNKWTLLSSLLGT